jgi:hypothetical protein
MDRESNHNLYVATKCQSIVCALPNEVYRQRKGHLAIAAAMDKHDAHIMQKHMGVLGCRVLFYFILAQLS